MIIFINRVGSAFICVRNAHNLVKVCWGAHLQAFKFGFLYCLGARQKESAYLWFTDLQRPDETLS